jgi:hypothetical protein
MLPQESEGRYKLGLGLIFVGAILFTVVGHLPVPHFDGWWGQAVKTVQEFTRSVGEALFVSLIIAILVEPSIRRQFARSLGRDLWWVLSSSDAPSEFREAVKTLASLQRYYVACNWELEFSWADLHEAYSRFICPSAHTELI